MIGNAGVNLGVKGAPQKRCMLALLDLLLHALDAVAEDGEQPGFRLLAPSGVDFLPIGAVLMRHGLINHGFLLRAVGRFRPMNRWCARSIGAYEWHEHYRSSLGPGPGDEGVGLA